MHTIKRNGFLFRYAYWFTRERDRPMQVNRCPFFRRLIFITLVAMPLWWLVWAPIGLVFGFFFAARPRFFESDGVEWEDDMFSAWTEYTHWPKHGREVIRPIVLIVPSIFIVFLLCLGHLAWRGSTQTMIDGHNVAFWIVISTLCAVGTILFLAILKFGILGLRDRLQKQEWYQVSRDFYRSKKEGFCPTYKVVD